MIKLQKTTFNDLRAQADDLRLGWLSDFDESYLYFQEWKWSDEGDRGYDVTTKYSYAWTEGVLSVDVNSGSVVVKQTEYKEAPQPLEKRLGLIEKLLQPFMVKNKEEEVTILKQFDQETWTVHEPLYTPANVVDGHGDVMDEDGVKNLVKSFNEGKDAGTIQPSLFHKTKTKSFTIGKAWYLEEPKKIGNTIMPAFTPMVEIVMKSQKLFDARVEGKITGLSIGALGKGELLKEFRESFIKAKRKLIDFSFLHKGAHLSYTDWSVGGAASGINDVYEVVKKEMAEELTAGQEELMKFLEEEYDPIEKKLRDKDSVETCEKAPSTPSEAGAQDAGVDNETLLNKGKETKTMVDEVKKTEAEEALRKEFEAYKKSVKIEKSLTKYGFEDEVTSNLALALATSDEVETAVLKALDAIVTSHEAKLETLEKSQEQTPAPKDPLAEKIDKELGHKEEQEENVEKSLNSLASDKLRNRLAKYNTNSEGK